MTEIVKLGTTNATLWGYLTRLSWTPERFAYHLNGFARELRVPVTPIHPKTPWRWLDARPPAVRPCIPRQPWPGLACALLSRHLHEPVTLACLGWQTSAGALYVPADDGLDHPWTPAGAVASLREVLEAIGMDRRHFVVLTGSGLTVVAHDWLLDPQRVAAAVKGKRLDHAVVDDLERVAEARRRLNDSLGGGTLFGAVREDLRLVTGLLSNGSYTEEVGRRLYAVAAEFARLAGWLAYDNNEEALARRFFMAALRAAHSSGDRAVGANVLGFMSIQARYRDPRDATRIAESALSKAADLTPALVASLHGRLAVSAACAGEVATAERAQQRMFDLLAGVDPATEPPYMYWWSEAEAYYFAGQSASALNNLRQAESHYRSSVARLDPNFLRDRSSWLLRLATTRLQLRELDGACRAASESALLVRRLDSQHNRNRLVEFRQAAQRFANTAQIKEFDTKFGDLLHTS